MSTCIWSSLQDIMTYLILVKKIRPGTEVCKNWHLNGRFADCHVGQFEKRLWDWNRSVAPKHRLLKWRLSLNKQYFWNNSHLSCFIRSQEKQTEKQKCFEANYYSVSFIDSTFKVLLKVKQKNPHPNSLRIWITAFFIPSSEARCKCLMFNVRLFSPLIFTIVYIKKRLVITPRLIWLGLMPFH